SLNAGAVFQPVFKELEFILYSIRYSGNGHHLLFFKAKVFLVHKYELLAGDQGAANEQDRNGKLKAEQHLFYAENSSVFERWQRFAAFNDMRRPEAGDNHCGI